MAEVIARTWRGATRAKDGDDYVAYLHETGFAEYRGTAGNRGVLALRRTYGDTTEFLLVSLWESMDAIRAFAGPAAEKAVFYPEDDRFLIDRDDRVSHYDVAYADLPDGLR